MSEIDCDQVLNEIELYLDDELDAAQRREIEEHLAGCGDCLSHKEFQEGLQAVIRRKCGTDSVPTDLLDRIRGRLEAEASS